MTSEDKKCPVHDDTRCYCDQRPDFFNSSEDMLREILKATETIDDTVKCIMQWHKEEMKKLVPEERLESYYHQNHWKAEVYNECRNEILRAIEENL